MTTIKWIPVAERLPEKDGEYIVSLIQRRVCTSISYVAGEGGGWNCHRSVLTNIVYKDYEFLDVVAWAEDIEPYIVGEKEE